MTRVLKQQTEDNIEKHKLNSFCEDCERYKAFCDGRRIWFDDDDYWVCERCIRNGRPEQEEQSEQQTILKFIAGDA